MIMRYYVCPEHKEFDHLHKDQKILSRCPKCGKKVIQQLGLNFRLNGPGFYSTDNK